MLKLHTLDHEHGRVFAILAPLAPSAAPWQPWLFWAVAGVHQAACQIQDGLVHASLLVRVVYMALRLAHMQQELAQRHPRVHLLTFATGLVCIGREHSYHVLDAFWRQAFAHIAVQLTQL